MITTTRRVVVLALLAALAACGGDSDDPTDPDTQGGQFFFRATIDGAWSADFFTAAQAAPGVFVLSGNKSTGTNPYVLAISLYNIGGPGTYPLGVGSTVAGGSIGLSTPQGGWTSPMSGADGSITITSLTSTAVAGTFNFTAVPVAGAQGTKAATNGEFNLQFLQAAQIGPLPDNAGSKASATIAGVAFNAAQASGSYFAANRVASVNAGNNTRVLGFSLNEVTGPGTFALTGTSRFMTVTSIGSAVASWTSGVTGGSGSVTITSLTATRMRGTFTATLVPLPGTSATGSLAITGGSFDIGLGAPPE